MSPPDSTQPRIALVTGAGSGIGRATTHALLADGWQVVLAGRRAAALHDTVAAAPAHTSGPAADRCLVQPTDVSDPTQVAALFAAITQRLGRLDLLFNNAGVFTPGVALEDLPFEQWQAALAVNLSGPFLCTQHAFKLMKAQTPPGGRIINNGSISAHAPRPNSVAYTSTKHAITGLTKASALDGRAHGIAVGQIDIGNAVSEMTASMGHGMPQADGSLKPEARMAVEHAARAVLHMANLPLDANVLFMTVMATGMPFVGRG